MERNAERSVDCLSPADGDQAFSTPTANSTVIDASGAAKVGNAARDFHNLVKRHKPNISYVDATNVKPVYVEMGGQCLKC